MPVTSVFLPLTGVQALISLDIMFFKNDSQILTPPHPPLVVISLGFDNTDFLVMLVTLYFEELLQLVLHQHLEKVTGCTSETRFELVVFISDDVWL